MATSTDFDEDKLRESISNAIRKNQRFLIEKEIQVITEECLGIMKRFIAENNLQKPF